MPRPSNAGGTRVSVLAERAQITKRSMAELVVHLERHGCVERVPNPDHRRAKLVRATRRGEEVCPSRASSSPEPSSVR